MITTFDCSLYFYSSVSNGQYYVIVSIATGFTEMVDAQNVDVLCKTNVNDMSLRCQSILGNVTSCILLSY